MGMLINESEAMDMFRKWLAEGTKLRVMVCRNYAYTIMHDGVVVEIDGHAVVIRSGASTVMVYPNGAVRMEYSEPLREGKKSGEISIEMELAENDIVLVTEGAAVAA